MLPHPPSCSPSSSSSHTPPSPATAAAGPRGGCSAPPRPLGRRCRSAGAAVVASAGCRQRCLSRCPAGRERGAGGEGRRCPRGLWEAAPEGERASAVRCGLLPSPARSARRPASVSACVLIGAVAIPEFCRGEATRGREGGDFRGPRSAPDGRNDQKTSRLALNLLNRAIPFSLRFNLWFVVILFMWS